ncbi:MAG: TonB-dependent receptor [Melioribacteraceae bacterium]|nr:TonB-dependent receptor [Melioribacteraceae bacterium]
MKHITILSFFIFFQQILLSQNSLTGRVIGADNKPLESANVILKGAGIGTSTNAEGQFTLRGNFTDESVILFSFVGLESRSVLVADFIRNNNTITLKRKLLTSQTVLVKSSIGKKGVTPGTFSQLSSEEISERYSVQDIPEMLSYLPSTTFYSEGGAGIGYNYLSIRGFDQRRISISINGIPQNDPEDHNVYWVDFPDLLESTEFIQVQRGGGSGVVGYPAIGGSINIITSPFSDEQKTEFAVSAGSYNTRKYSASVSSGLVDQKYSIYANISQLLSSGYRDRNWVNFRSYHLSAVRYDENLTTQINLFGGPIADGLVYTGLPKFAVNDKNLRRTNFSYWEASNNQFTYTVERAAEEKEEFSQPHFELMNEYKLNEDITLNSALFMVLGRGFFDYDGSWAPYSYFRITPENGFNVTGDPNNLYFSNMLIRAWVDNKQYGWMPKASIKHDGGELIVGGEFRIHRSAHWGEINHASELPAGVNKLYQYYYYEGEKNIYGFYVNENYSYSEKLNFLVEAKFSYHNYKLTNEKYIGTEFEVSDLFFNPRLGVNYKFDTDVTGYVSYARVTREPRLKNYYDAAEASDGFTKPQFAARPNGEFIFDEPLVKPENMNSFDIGVNYTRNNYGLSLNLYYMIFNDEIINSGQLDRFGQPVTGNIDGSVHSGIELSGNYNFMNGLSLIFNASYGNNEITDGHIFVTDDTAQVHLVDMVGNKIGGFPELTANLILSYRNNGFLAQAFFKYVGDYYSDNYSDNLSNYLNKYPGFVGYDDNLVESYFVTNLNVNYEFDMPPYFKNVRVFAQVNNVLDNLYAAYAIGKEFFPAAERNFMTGIKLGL